MAAQDIVKRFQLSAALRNAKRQKLSADEVQKIANDLVRAGYPVARMTQDLTSASFSSSEITSIIDAAYPSNS